MSRKHWQHKFCKMQPRPGGGRSAFGIVGTALSDRMAQAEHGQPTRALGTYRKLMKKKRKENAN